MLCRRSEHNAGGRSAQLQRLVARVDGLAAVSQPLRECYSTVRHEPQEPAVQRHRPGARASAHLYSLIEAAKANELEPYAYLHRVFSLLPAATTVEDIEALLLGAHTATD